MRNEPKTVTLADRRRVALETDAITERGSYTRDGVFVELPGMEAVRAVEYIPAQPGAPDLREAEQEGRATYILTNLDSFEAAHMFAEDPARAAVHNYASAKHAGGGFHKGAKAQEESLCRESTLFASITTPLARLFYDRNRGWKGQFYPDDMLYSPHVVVFRDNALNLLEEPFVTSVFTLPAPNCSYHARAGHAKPEDVRQHMTERLETMCRAASERGVRTLVLGAWGCGAFHVDPGMVADLTREVLIAEGWGKQFDTIVFAIRGDGTDENFRIFQDTFRSELGHNVYTGAVTPNYVY